MSIDFNQAIGLQATTLALRAERTKVLASNLANESTPGYQARDIDFAASLRDALAGGDDAGPRLDDEAAAQKYRVPYHPTQDGNTVELGVEQATFSQNVSEFQASLRFLDMKLKGLAKAIEGR